MRLANGNSTRSGILAEVAVILLIMHGCEIFGDVDVEIHALDSHSCENVKGLLYAESIVDANHICRKQHGYSPLYTI